MADAADQKSHENASQLEKKEPNYEELQRAQYLDPEGGYKNPELGLKAEKIAMMSVPPISKQALPTKMYLESTVTPTLMMALQEVAEARPENPLEFVAYYLLKHNPNRKQNSEGAPIGHYHPNDPTNPKRQDGVESK